MLDVRWDFVLLVFPMLWIELLLLVEQVEQAPDFSPGMPIERPITAAGSLDKGKHFVIRIIVILIHICDSYLFLN